MKKNGIIVYVSYGGDEFLPSIVGVFKNTSEAFKAWRDECAFYERTGWELYDTMALDDPYTRSYAYYKEGRYNTHIVMQSCTIN